jgi:hypothetical protein
MIVLHSPAETYTFSFSFLWLFLGLPACALTTKMSTPSSSSAASVMMKHTWCMLLMYLSSDIHVLSSLLETPPFQVVKSALTLLPKFWLEPLSE